MIGRRTDADRAGIPVDARVGNGDVPVPGSPCRPGAGADGDVRIARRSCGEGKIAQRRVVVPRNVRPEAEVACGEIAVAARARAEGVGAERRVLETHGVLLHRLGAHGGVLVAGGRAGQRIGAHGRGKVGGGCRVQCAHANTGVRVAGDGEVPGLHAGERVLVAVVVQEGARGLHDVAHGHGARVGQRDVAGRTEIPDDIDRHMRAAPSHLHRNLLVRDIDEARHRRRREGVVAKIYERGGRAEGASLRKHLDVARGRAGGDAEHLQLHRPRGGVGG